MKPLSFKLLSIRVAAFFEIKFLALSFICSALVSSAPFFLFLDSSPVCCSFSFSSPCPQLAQFLLENLVMFDFLAQYTLP